MSSTNCLELVVPTKELSYILGFASSVVEKRNVLSELGNVKIIANNGILEIAATDVDLYLNQTTGAEVIQSGETTVSIATFSEIVKKIPDKEIRLKKEAESSYLKILGNSCEFDLMTLPADNFPQMEEVDSDQSITIDSQELARLIEYTCFAVSTQETRYNLSGIYLHTQNNHLCSAATDAHRFAVAVSTQNVEAENYGVILPKKTVTELLKIVKDTKNNLSQIKITFGSNKIKFECNNLVLLSKIIDGNFPEYDSFIPQITENKLTVNTKLLASSIERASIVTTDKHRSIKLIFSDLALNITASGEARGVANEEIKFSSEDSSYCQYIGSPVALGFNPKYITDVLNALREEQVEIYLGDSSSPLLIKTSENPQDNFVIMPVKV